MAIRTKTVFVVGAGASLELGLPLGSDLLSKIGEAFDYKINAYGEADAGDQRLWREISGVARENGHRTTQYVEAALRVRAASHLGLSIDNIIHQQNDDKLFVLCAKLAIAAKILEAERSSDLRVHENFLTMTWPKVRGTWLGGFAQLVVQDLERRSLETIFDNVSVVSFNYDRTIRRFMPLALASQFNLPAVEAEQLSKSLPIFHPYGALGRLPIEGEPSVQFGADTSLTTVAANIRTFTEQIENDDSLIAMQNALSDADRIVFLGFGYLAQNMELLARDVTGNASDAMGTSYGLSDPDRDLVRGQLSHFFRDYYRPNKTAVLSPLKCADYIRENFRTLTS